MSMYTVEIRLSQRDRELIKSLSAPAGTMKPECYICGRRANLMTQTRPRKFFCLDDAPLESIHVPTDWK